VWYNWLGDAMNKYKVGQVLQGTITQIEPYGAFVKTDDGETGLVHISEIADDFIPNVNLFVKRGEKVIVKIIDIDSNGRYRMSLKAIQPSRSYYQIPHSIDDIHLKIGFKSLEEKLDGFIKKAMEEIK